MDTRAIQAPEAKREREVKLDTLAWRDPQGSKVSADWREKRERVGRMEDHWWWTDQRVKRVPSAGWASPVCKVPKVKRVRRALAEVRHSMLWSTLCYQIESKNL